MRRRCVWLFVVLLAVLSAAMAAGEEGMVSPAPEDAKLYFITPRDGDVVTNPVTVRFGLRGMGVAPAGVAFENTGHHHLLIDVDELPPMDRPLPNTDATRHFGGGETEAEIELPPGEHSLRLLFGNHLHVPHDPPVKSQEIRITVREEEAAEARR